MTFVFNNLHSYSINTIPNCKVNFHDFLNIYENILPFMCNDSHLYSIHGLRSNQIHVQFKFWNLYSIISAITTCQRKRLRFIYAHERFTCRGWLAEAFTLYVNMPPSVNRINRWMFLRDRLFPIFIVKYHIGEDGEPWQSVQCLGNDWGSCE